MTQLTLLFVLACLIQSEWIVAKSVSEVRPDIRFTSQTNSPLDCTKYTSDYEILSSFSFVTYLNPLTMSTSNTYGKMDANENVYYLNIANQRFVPTTVFCLKSLQELYVRSTSFYQFGIDDDFVRQLPAEIELLAPSLKYLGVYDSTVTHLPAQIAKLTHLSSLVLSNTGLVVLPDSIGNLSSLQYLTLSNNKLTSLPTTIINIRTLLQITLTNNVQLRSVQSLNGLPNVNILDTTSCPIERIPLNLPNLYSLQMSNNNLTDLVGIRTLGDYTGISKAFYFNMNRIRFLPPQIGYVRSLYRLDLDHNELASLPLDIFNVTTLRHLYIRNNLFSGTELRAIAIKFNTTNPALSLYYLPGRGSSMKSSS